MKEYYKKTVKTKFLPKISFKKKQVVDLKKQVHSPKKLLDIPKITLAKLIKIT